MSVVTFWHAQLPAQRALKIIIIIKKKKTKRKKCPPTLFYASFKVFPNSFVASSSLAHTNFLSVHIADSQFGKKNKIIVNIRIHKQV